MTGFKLSCWWKELLKTENCKSWIVWKCKSTFFPLWSSKGLYVVCSLMLLNNIYWWRCAVFLNLPHKKNIIQLVFTHSPRSGYMITPQGYPRPNFLLSSNVTILPTHLLRFFKKKRCVRWSFWVYLSKKKNSTFVVAGQGMCLSKDYGRFSSFVKKGYFHQISTPINSILW